MVVSSLFGITIRQAYEYYVDREDTKIRRAIVCSYKVLEALSDVVYRLL